MKKIIFLLLILLLLGAGAFLLIQIIPLGGEQSNPPVLAEPNWNSPRTRELFMRVCGDCHSNETVWLWYSKIAPVSWLVIRDVNEGRGKFNVSEWGRGENESEESFELYKSGEMPMKIYLIMHPEARLSGDEKGELLEGLLATFGAGEGGEGGEDD